jgi:hypothetical protein
VLINNNLSLFQATRILLKAQRIYLRNRHKA